MKNNLFAILSCATCLAAVSLATARDANAGAFYIPLQSATVYGSSLAGAASEVRDASTIFYNPAGLTKLDGAEIYGSAHLVLSGQEFTDTGSTLFGAPVGGQTSNNPVPFLVVPNLFGAYPVTEDLWVGLGITSPFGLNTQYRGDAFNRFDSIESELLTLDIQPTVAYQVTDWLSIGGGVNFQYADGELQRAVTDGFSVGRSTLEGIDWTTGYTLGLTVKPLETTTLGVTYRSKISHELDGRVIISDTIALNENSAATADVDLPESVFIGASHKLNDRLTLLAEADWTGWDSFSDLTVVRDNGTIASSEEQNYQPTWLFAIGAEYALTEDVTVRGGYHYEPTPTVSEFRSTQVPDGDRHSVSAGMSYDISDKLRFDLAASYVALSDEDINVTRNAGFANVRAETEDGEIGIVSLGLRYKF